MAETVNIGKMAEILSKEIFTEFLWKRTGPLNQNYKCESKDVHKNDTHPSDVVFYYDEPYSLERTYVHCDLKSYAKDSIQTESVKKALESLSRQISCAEVSEEWRKLYLHDDKSYSIVGLLFVYNHDGEYDNSFQDLLSHIKPSSLSIPPGSRIFVLGPREVFWLSNVSLEIQRLTGGREPEIPRDSKLSFFYPQLVRRANIQEESAEAATLETLTSPYIVMQCLSSDHISRHYYVFYSRKGESPREFMYLIDVFRKHGLLGHHKKVTVKTLQPSEHAYPNFEKAKQQYIEGVVGPGKTSELSEQVSNINYHEISNIKTVFSSINLGMSDERIS